MYGFHKISRRKNELIFHHEFFIRGRQEQYYMIKRKCKNDGNGGLKELINYKIGEEMKRMEDCEPNFAELLKQLL